MTEQLKAEAYVRSQRPALMELSFGCAYKQNGEIYLFDGKVTAADLERNTPLYRVERQSGKAYITTVDQIIGHPIQLQDWLAVLGKYGFKIVYGAPDLLSFMPREGNSNIHFELSTGQPARESEYKAFNDIVGV